MIKKIAEGIRQNKNIIEKKDISPIVHYIEKNSFKNRSRIFSDIGEDSAAINDGNSFFLLTTDRIKTEFIKKFPFGAGFSSILVGVDDIYCCGGTPLAASIIISFKDSGKGQQIIEGISEGSRKFKVPIVRGHTNPSGWYELSSTMVGEIKKKNYISAKNAQVNDNIIVAVDFDGKVGKASNMYWDNTTFKSSEEVLKKRKSLNIIAERHLANSSKDISNGGVFGTLLQLIKYSNVGASVNLNDIEIPPKLLELGYTLDIYVNMFLSTSYILTAPDINCKSMIQVFKNHGMEAKVIGKIIKEKHLLKINDGKDSLDVIKF